MRPTTPSSTPPASTPSASTPSAHAPSASTTPDSTTRHHPPRRPRRPLGRRIGRRWLAVAVAAFAATGVAVAVQSSGGTGATPAPEPAPAPGYRQADLLRDTDAIHALGVTGVQARVSTTAGPDLVATSGVAVAGTARPVPRDGYFRIASTGKTLMATLILQLADEGKLSLDDTVESRLPGVVVGNGNDGLRITVRQLLQNTSGLHDDLPGFDTPQQYYQHRYDTYTAERIVARAMKHRPDFPPGTGFGYSNTGYVLLGMIAEKTTGHPWPKEIEKRILAPLGMNRTYLSGATPTLRNPHADGYQVFTTGEGTGERTGEHTEERIDVTEQLVPDLGGYVSTTADINRFFQGLLGGKLLSGARMADMRNTVPVDKRLETFWPRGRYGLGLVNRPLTCGGSYWSHEGGEAGYITLDGATDDGSRTVTVSMSTSFNDLDKTLRQHKAASDLVDRALCNTPHNSKGK